MNRWKRAWIAAPLCAALGLVPGAGGEALARGGGRSAPRLAERGIIRYVLAPLPGVTGGEHQLLVPSRGGREPMDGPNSPSRLHPELGGSNLLFRREIRGGWADVSVFPSSWWPQSSNGIAHRWRSRISSFEDLTSDPENLSPVEKYDLLFHPGQRARLPEVRSWTVEQMKRPVSQRGAPRVQPAVRVAGPATAWELSHHGVYQRVYPDSWWGHCNGWAAYATTEPGGAPRRDVRVRRSGGAVVECGAWEAGCVLFRMADIEALMTELYYNDAATFAGRRCNKEPDEVIRDAYGRPVDPACRDLVPGTLHVAMTGLLGAGAAPLAPGASGRRRIAFVADHRWDYQVWSYPVTRFSIDEIEDVSGGRAMDLVCGGEAGGGRCTSYRFNPGATRFARVKARYWLVAYAAEEASLLTPPEQRTARLIEEELHYVLEMDGAGRILGGEWIKAPSAWGADGRRQHPDFLWLAARPQGAGEDGDDLGGSGDNPYISLGRVRQILALSRAPGR